MSYHPTEIRQKKGINEFEFVALMAFLMSNVALSIDTILPALPDIGTSLQVSNTSRLQLVIVLIFLGLGIGELIFGTLSDSFGRKSIVGTGVGIFTLASFLIVWSPNLELLLIGRVFQGVGLSASRSVSIAIIRDTHEGNRMARIMSFIMTIFILVPMVAPLLGQLILKAYNWEAIFYFQILFISITLLWFWIRQSESLTKEKRIPFSKYIFTNGLKEFIRHKKTLIYTFSSGLIQGAFIAYLGSAQKIFQEQYQMVEEFPYIFGGLALAIGLSTLSNGVLVLKYGMQKLVMLSLFISIISAVIYLFLFVNGSNPPLMALIAFLFIQFLTLGFTFGNLSSMAMEPIGHIAGIGAAFYSFISISTGVLVAISVGFFIHDTAAPLFAGFFLTGMAAMLLIKSTSKVK